MRASGLVGGVCLIAGCTDPMANVRAIWIDSVHGQRGERTVHVLGPEGEDTFELDAVVLGGNAELVQVEQAAGGRRMLFRGFDRTTFDDVVKPPVLYVDSADRRSFSFEAGADLSFTSRGDAVYWTTFGVVTVLPVHGARLAPQPLALTTPSGGTIGEFVSVSATSASLIVALEASGPLADPRGPTALAIRYPDETDSTVEPGVSEIASSVVLSGFPLGSPLVDPDGHELVVVEPSAPCDLWRWRIGEGFEALEGGPAFFSDLCVPAWSPIGLVAPGTLVSADLDRVYVHDLDRAQTRSVPRPRGPTWQARVDHGRAFVLGSRSGPFVRVDSDFVGFVSTEQTTCDVESDIERPPDPVSRRVVVSPSGTWAAWSCLGLLEGALSSEVVIRVSPLGLERFDGIPMEVLAVDDRGGIVVYSYEPGEVDEARRLYVITGDGVLEQVSRLEPTPEEMIVAGEGRWVTAQAID